MARLAVTGLCMALACFAAAEATSNSAAQENGAAEAGVPGPYHTNIVEQARANTMYRRVVFTGARSQIALMSIPPGEDIGYETHPHVEQLLFFVSGSGQADLDGAVSPIRTGDVLVITPGVRHDVTNTGNEPLKLYTIYTPPNHIDGRVQATKKDAEADKADEDFGRHVR